MSETTKRSIIAKLCSLRCGDFIAPPYLMEEGVFFSDGRFGELIFLMKPGNLIVPSYMGNKPACAMHGFSPHEKTLAACFLSKQYR
ncbi:MAG: hypothetical protein ACFFCW_08335 [Candidatus Hodarchaeota archaeon]